MRELVSFAEVMEEREVVEGRLGDTALGEQAEAAVERRFHYALWALVFLC